MSCVEKCSNTLSSLWSLVMILNKKLPEPNYQKIFYPAKFSKATFGSAEYIVNLDPTRNTIVLAIACCYLGKLYKTCNAVLYCVRLLSATY